MTYLIVQDIHGVYNLLNADLIRNITIKPEPKGNGAIVRIKHKHFGRGKFIVSDLSKITASTLETLTDKLK